MRRLAGYRAPWWLPGGHLQTIYASVAVPRRHLSYRRERWDTPDGDFIDLDWTTGDKPCDTSPERRLLVVFHGLEGSARSHYALALMHAARARGWDGVVVHFRGCSGTPNHLPRAYHSGDSHEIDWILRRLASTRAPQAVHAVGISLGGNALLKWLGEQGRSAADVVVRAVAVSAPLDLMAAGDALGRGFNMIYTREFLKTLKAKSLAKLTRHPEIYDAGAVAGSKTLRAFDNVVTAPLHGFRDTDDYWTRSSSKPLLAAVEVPTLVINALNDPFLPPSALPASDMVSFAVTLEYPETGGHVGFVSGPFPGNHDWLPDRVFAFFGHPSAGHPDCITAADDQ